MFIFLKFAYKYIIKIIGVIKKVFNLNKIFCYVYIKRYPKQKR